MPFFLSWYVAGVWRLINQVLYHLPLEKAQIICYMGLYLHLNRFLSKLWDVLQSIDVRKILLNKKIFNKDVFGKHFNIYLDCDIATFKLHDFIVPNKH